MESYYTARTQVVDRGFDWLLANLTFFDPFAEDNKIDFLGTKAITELAFICAYFLRHSGYVKDDRLVTIIDFTEHTAQQPIFRAHLVREPDQFLLYGTIHVALEACGRADPDLHDLIQQLIDIGYITAIEYVPFRKLDLRYILDIGGYKHQLPDYSSLYQETALYHLPPVVYLTNSDVYSITHTLFYLSDFGQRDLTPILNERFKATCEIVTLLLGMYTRSHDWDLVGELLICCHCLNWRPFPLFHLAWKGLLGAQTAQGDVPGPYFEPDSPELSQPETACAYRFKQNYHTTLVAMLACLLESQWSHTNEQTPTA